MKYKLLIWKIRNMGFFGIIKNFLMKPKRVDAIYKEYPKFNEPPYIANGRKCLIFKANGLKYEEYIRKSLTKKLFKIESEYRIDDYTNLMIRLFAKLSAEELSAWEAVNRTYYSDKNGKSTAIAFILEADSDMNRLEKFKRYLRRKIGVQILKVYETMPDGTVYIFKTTITPLHVPDFRRMERECSWVMQLGRRVESVNK